MIEWINHIDRAILLAINGSHTPFLDSIMWFASGTLTWLPFYILLTGLLIYKFKRNSLPLLQLHFVDNYQGGLYGFVSSHAANVFALAFYLNFVAAEKIPWLLYILFPWALFVSMSRVYLGVHY